MGDLDFSHEDVERASRYHRPLYVALGARLLLAVAVYSLLAWSWIGDRVWGAVDSVGWAGAAAAWAGAVTVLAAAVRPAAELRKLSGDAGVPVGDVLVSDASRRTTKSNAYVSGLGATRRVVLWDTLLESVGEREVKLVIAHELGHRRERHAAKFT